jgi:RimJ/RimL family protein N-acetyltransferase
MSSSISPSRPVIRPATEADRGDLRRFFAGLSSLSSFRRFFGGGFRATDPMLDVLLRKGLPGGARVAAGPGGIVGHALWTPIRSRPEAAEVAFVVADDLQGTGLGTRLARATVGDAARLGVGEIEFLVLADNEPANRLVQRQWPGAQRTEADGEVEYRVALGPAAVRAVELRPGLRPFARPAWQSRSA